MSSRTVPQLALAALLACAAPAIAQEKLPEAPMPRPKPAGRFEIELKWTTGGPAVTLSPTPMVPPVPPSGDVMRSTCTTCLQTLRDEVYMLASETSRGPSACGGCGIRSPQTNNAFVIGVGGLRRVMPLPEAPRFLVQPTPVPTGSFVINPGHIGLQQIAFGPALTQPAHGGCVVIGTQATVAQATTCDVCANASAGPLSGTWYRDLGVALIAVTFTGDEMTLKITQREDGTVVTMTATAHYTLTKDGLVFGAITSADVDVSGKADNMELAELSMQLQELIDRPFSFRTKKTSAGLAVSGLKVAVHDSIRRQELAMFGGVYKHAPDGKVPELKPLKAKTAGRCEACEIGGGVVGTALGTAVGAATGRPLVGVAIGAAEPVVERIGIDFSVPVAQPVVPAGAIMPPAVLPTAPALMPPPRPVGAAIPNDAMKQMAGDAFAQMFEERRSPPRSKVLEHYPQYFCPDPAIPLPRELAAQGDRAAAAVDATRCVIDPCYPERYNAAVGREVIAPFPAQVHNGTSAAKPGHVGTWVREVGSKRCVLKVAADHFTVTVSEAQELENGKTTTGHLTFTVDYHLARDGVTAVGLLTGVDVKFDGELPDCDVETLTQKTGELQKLLEDRPVALSLRVYSDALVVGNVRMQSVGMLTGSEPAAYLGGRYRLMTEKALSPLKAVKVPKPQPLPTYGTPPVTYGPPPAHINPPGGFAAPVPQPHYPPAYGAPVGDLLPPQNIGAPAPRPPSVVSLPPIPLAEAAPVASIQPAGGITIPEARTMPTPTTPIDADDLRQIQNEWRKFWFPDDEPQPKPKPVRVMPQPKPPGAVRPAGPPAISDGFGTVTSLDGSFVVPTKGDNRQLFNFSIGVFGSK